MGKHVVELRLGKNPPVSRIVDIEAGKTSRLQVKLVAPKVAAVAGALQLLSDPTPVDAYVDGAFAGKTPLKLDKLALGSHVVALKWPGYKTAERTVTIEPKRLVTLKLKLESATTASGPSSAPTGGLGNLIVVASIRGATVYLNGARVGKTPFARAKLTAGMHEVRVVASGYEPMDDQVQVTAGRTARVTAILQPLPAGGGAVAGGGVAGGPGVSAPADGGSGGTAALSAFGAQLVPPRAFTADLSLGFPHLVSLRLVTGVFDRKHLGLDVGVTVRSYGTVTEGSITGRVRLLRYDPFALAVFGELGAGGGPLDRDTFFFKVGVLGTLLFKDIISVTASVYGDFYSERICPTSEQADEPEACTFPPEDLSFDEVRGRFTAARIFLAATIEASLSPTINLFAQIEGAPFQAQRRSYTDAFASYMLDTDPRFYGRVGVAFKF